MMLFRTGYSWASRMNSRLALQSVINRLEIKRFRAVWILCLTLGVLDFLIRFPISLEPRKNLDYEVSTFKQYEVMRLRRDQLDRYLIKLKRYSGPIDSKDLLEVSVEAKESQIELNRLDRWVGLTNSYQLLAIFRGASTFAVLRRTSLEGGAQEVIEVRAGEIINDYVVVKMSGRVLTLQGPLKDIVRLILFIPADQRLPATEIPAA